MSLAVLGNVAEGWSNPNSNAKNALNNRKMDMGLSIQDIVDNVLKKPTFGFPNYEPKAVVKDLLPVKVTKVSK